MQLPRYPLEMNTCSAVGVYISPQIRILHTKHFFAHQLKGKPKNHREFRRYCNISNYNISIQQAAMFVYGSIEDHGCVQDRSG